MYVKVLHHCVCFKVVKKFKKLKFDEYASRVFFFFFCCGFLFLAPVDCD